MCEGLETVDDFGSRLVLILKHSTTIASKAYNKSRLSLFTSSVTGADLI